MTGARAMVDPVQLCREILRSGNTDPLADAVEPLDAELAAQLRDRPLSPQRRDPEMVRAKAAVKLAYQWLREKCDIVSTNKRLALILPHTRVTEAQALHVVNDRDAAVNRFMERNPTFDGDGLISQIGRNLVN